MPDERQLLQGIRTVHERSPDLLGYEPTTSSFDPDHEDDARQFLALWNDAQKAGAVVQAAHDDAGRIALWVQVYRFWLEA